MNFEVRYMGALIEHFETQEIALAYRDRRLNDKREGPAFVASELTVAPRRPVSLFCHGNLVDTFLKETDAAARREAILQESLERSPDRSRPRVTLVDFEISRSKFASPKHAPLPEVHDPAKERTPPTEPPPA